MTDRHAGYQLSDAASAAHTRIRNAHQDCNLDSCALRRMWAEDVQEGYAAWLAESTADPRTR